MMGLLFPRKCILCRRLLETRETWLCTACRGDAPVCPLSRQKQPYLDSWVAVWYYEEKVRASLRRYKFLGTRAYAPGYGHLLAQRLTQEYPAGFDVLTWIPVSPRRKWKRGFDQVQLLAKYVGRELGMKPQSTLVKVRHNRPQSGVVHPALRRANVLGVYQVAHPELVRGKRVLLLDDIITTGATAGEAARVLLTAGAKEVYFGAVAAARHDTIK